MEMFELRYFLAVARCENINRASEQINVSAPALSKAISRLEEELGVSLFVKEGRNIKLSPHGRTLQRRASDIVQLEENVRSELTGGHSMSFISIAGPEVFLENFGIGVKNSIKKILKECTFEWMACDESTALKKLSNGEVTFAIVSCILPSNFSSKLIGMVNFQTCASQQHKLIKKFDAKSSIPISDVLSYPFVSSREPIFGTVSSQHSKDGWRDDIFPRKISHYSSSLQIVSKLVKDGECLAYLPDYLVEKIGATTIKTSGCPYSCKQKVYLATSDSKKLSWLNKLFSENICKV